MLTIERDDDGAALFGITKKNVDSLNQSDIVNVSLFTHPATGEMVLFVPKFTVYMVPFLEKALAAKILLN